MLISTRAITKWNGKTKKYYEYLGYKFTNMFEEFYVDLKDLQRNSNAKVDVKCDGNNCGKILNICWGDYLKCVHEDGTYYCKKCASNLYGNKNTQTTRLKNGKSFEQWCIENNKQDVLDRWDYELNKLKPSEVSYGSNKKFYFSCPKGIHKSELNKLSDFTNDLGRVINCKACNSFAQWGINHLGDTFLEKYWDYEKNTVDPWELSRGNNYKSIYIKCQKKEYHETYQTLANSFTNLDCRCPFCTNRNGKVHKLDSLGTLYSQVLELWSDKNKKSSYEYSSMSGEYIWWKCKENKHIDYYRSISSSNIYEFRCPECSNEKKESFIQEKVRLYLGELGYYDFTEYNSTLKCINPLTNYRLPYDNEIIINNIRLIIEVHGSQHYDRNCIFHKLSAKKFNTNPEQEFKYLQQKDKYKEEYALLNGYKYLIIPYYTDDTKETWKELINNKIEEILHIDA